MTNEFSKGVALSYDIQAIINESVPKINAISSNEMNEKPLPEKWSKKQILGHLIDSAYNNHRRFLEAMSQDNLIFDGYNQAEWVELNNYQNRTIEDVLSTFELVQLHLSQAIRQLPNDLLERKTTVHNFHKICMNRIEAAIETNLEYLITDYIFHLNHHLKQI